MARRRAPPPPPRATIQVPLWALLLLGAGAILALVLSVPEDAVRRANHRLRGQFRSQDTVILVVLDSARADHTSLCGYERPTTPILNHLAASPGAVHTCAAVAPATWAIPSLASYVTGLDVPAHGVDTVRAWSPSGEEYRPTVRPLASAQTTLAEQLLDAGYQTALISENPLVNESSGLLQGYTYTRVTPRYPGARGQFVVDAANTLLRHELDPGRPLFLTLVLAASHEPLSPVPGGIPWVDKHSSLGCFGHVSGDCKDFLDGRMRGDARDTFVASLTDLYDYGLSRSDAHLGLVLDGLDAWGWRSGPWRMVVVGSSGVHLGEDGTYGQGNDVSEAVARVPLIALGSAPLPALGEGTADATISARDTWQILTSDTSVVSHPVVSYGNRTAAPRRGARDLATGSREAGAWSATEKVVWRDGAWYRTDLRLDPSGTALERLDATPSGLLPDVAGWLDVVGRGPLDSP